MTKDDTCLKMLEILHDIKHGNYGEDIYNAMIEAFPHFRECESFDGKNAETYLFKIVLRN